jgi:hypothetical protein
VQKQIAGEGPPGSKKVVTVEQQNPPFFSENRSFAATRKMEKVVLI